MGKEVEMERVVVMAEKLVLFKQRLMRSLLRPVIPAGPARVTI